MRVILLPLLAAAGAALSAQTQLPERSDAASDRAVCTDSITQVRDAAGQPRLDQSPAAPGEGLLIAAVDKRIDGCAVMQMHGRIDDLRPVPRSLARPARLIPLH